MCAIPHTHRAADPLENIQVKSTFIPASLATGPVISNNSAAEAPIPRSSGSQLWLSQPKPAPTGGIVPHIIFDTGCSHTQSLQSELLASSAVLVGHKGLLTRIVHGCSPEQQQALLEKKHLNPNYDIFFSKTYSFDPISKVEYTPRNKPGGIRDWLASLRGVSSDYLIAVVDPDFMFLQPFVVNTMNAENTLKPSFLTSKFKPLVDSVRPQQFLGQTYGLMHTWILKLDELKLDVGSPLHKLKRNTAGEDVLEGSVGPPLVGQ
jgi:hypothetical protein